MKLQIGYWIEGEDGEFEFSFIKPEDISPEDFNGYETEY